MEMRKYVCYIKKKYIYIRFLHVSHMELGTTDVGAFRKQLLKIFVKNELRLSIACAQDIFFYTKFN